MTQHHVGRVWGDKGWSVLVPHTWRPVPTMHRFREVAYVDGKYGREEHHVSLCGRHFSQFVTWLPFFQAVKFCRKCKNCDKASQSA